jgi:glycosyltransferase involved in cell wall biosynthesis
VIIPAFNQAALTRQCLDALRGCGAGEIIVVDDGSTDQTLAVARQFESPLVRIVAQRNQGAAAARNLAFSLSQGDYIQYLDADDLLSPDKIAKQMDAWRQCHSKRRLLSSAWGRFLYRYDRAKFIPSSLWCDLPRAEWLLRKMEQNIYMQTATWLVSRELAEVAGPWDTRLLGDDDGEYFCRVLLASEGVLFVPDARVYYRATGPGSLSHVGYSNRKLDAQWCSMQLHIGYLRSLENSERVRSACVRYMQNWVMLFYPERRDIIQQMKQMAKELEGELEIPYWSWKYAWIDEVFGGRLAKRARVYFPQLKWSLARFWDKTLFHLENQSRGAANVVGGNKSTPCQ